MTQAFRTAGFKSAKDDEDKTDVDSRKAKGDEKCLNQGKPCGFRNGFRRLVCKHTSSEETNRQRDELPILSRSSLSSQQCQRTLCSDRFSSWEIVNGTFRQGRAGGGRRGRNRTQQNFTESSRGYLPPAEPILPLLRGAHAPRHRLRHPPQPDVTSCMTSSLTYRTRTRGVTGVTPPWCSST